MTRPSLDWSDPIAVARWIGALSVSLKDVDGVVVDMLRPPRDRELGPALHARNYGEAWKQVVSAIEYATAPEPETGTGGAGSIH